MFDFLTETLAGDEIKERSGETLNIAWSRPEAGIIVLQPTSGYRQNIIISAAIHGNETAPIEIINRLISDILANKYTLKVRVMVILGNLEAMRQSERYINVDLNRLFSDHYLQYSHCNETIRAAKLQQVVADFYAVDPDKPRSHFDLHTAIRASHHIAFGLLPYLDSGRYQSKMMNWLQSVGLEALVVNHAPAATFSYFTSHQFAANSCTLELGKANPFGHNDLQQFVGIEQGLIKLISEEVVDVSNSVELTVYNVADVIIKLSDQFKLNVADDAANFSEFPNGYIIASDCVNNDDDIEKNKNVIYQVQQENGYILFPNRNVKKGLRAGLLLAKGDLSAISGAS
jgi:succinylglutamate desuccinylase